LGRLIAALTTLPTPHHTKTMAELYIGLMSGTSLDGVDGVLVEFSNQPHEWLKTVGHVHRPFDVVLLQELLALNTAGDNELHRAALCANQLAHAYAEVIQALLQQSGVPKLKIGAIGVHGQTVRHRPQEFDTTGYTLQLNNPALLAELCGIDVIADFRTRNLAAGGQGAPLVPAFHRAVFAQLGATVAVLNIGGISNLTVLHANSQTLGFDCGPGNALMDHWCQRHTGKPFDDAGAWAASGRVVAQLLTRLLADPYFAQTPPKSTGRDLFNPTWLDRHLQAQSANMVAVDVQATLTELTAVVCAQELRTHAPNAVELLVCGGGAFNQHLMQRLAVHAPSVQIMKTDERGLPATQVEATAFAWLAHAFVQREKPVLAAVTGALGDRILGALYPAA
jgi:anhydro-N-acetylmuramic acid kinase